MVHVWEGVSGSVEGDASWAGAFATSWNNDHGAGAVLNVFAPRRTASSTEMSGSQDGGDAELESVRDVSACLTPANGSAKPSPSPCAASNFLPFFFFLGAGSSAGVSRSSAAVFRLVREDLEIRGGLGSSAS
jgi:hypothetical protein